MRPQRQILWHQGLFLQPQHLQMQDLVNQALLAPLYRFALPFFWGVAELALDEGALREGAVLLEKGSFLFQDGSYAVLGANAVAEARVLRDAWGEGESSATVSVGLRRWNDSAANVSFPEGGGISSLATRLVALPEPETVCDLHAGGPAAQVQRQNFLLKLFFEKEVPQQGDYHLIPLVRLHKAGEGARLDESFVPPLVTLAASPHLTGTVTALRNLLAARLCAVARRRTLQGVALPLTRGDLALIMTQHSLQSYLALLTELCDAPTTHPWQLYLALCRLIAELATFSAAGIEGERVPRYDHGALSRCFLAVRDAVVRLLAEILAVPEDVVPLVREGEIYAADLNGSPFLKGNRYFLSLRSESDPAAMLRALQSSVKVSTREHLKVLSARALPGIGLTHAPITPPGVVPRLHTLYVELDQQHAQWPMVSSEQNLALYWDDAPSDLEIELVVLGSCSAP